MSKKFKSQASSARAANASAGFGSSAFGFGGQSAFQTSSSSSLSYIAEQPDLSRVIDPNLVVCLRNLGKKDSTTKSKALEDLQDYVTSTPASAIDEAVISAWCSLYPRTSIDNSRRVRQLAHSLQGSLASATTKRILPYLNKAIGPWLSGTFDNDRAVERAAQDALAAAFATSDKRKTLWKAYRESLLDYAEDAVLVQTVATLSDERSTTKDDAESKYSRVAGSAMLMLARLIETIDQDQTAQQTIAGKLEFIISHEKLWEFAYHPDPYLRRACCALVVLSARSNSSSIDWHNVSTCFVAKGLTTSQLGSSGPFIQSLTLLTNHHPSIWTTDYHAKTAVSKKLLQFLAKGSQRGPESYWAEVNTLIKSLPRDVIFSKQSQPNLDDATAFATALREGIGSQEEPRQNLTAAWACYIDLCFWLEVQVDGKEAQELFLTAHPLPLVATYTNPSPGSTILPHASGLQLAVSILAKLANDAHETLFKETEAALTQNLIEKMRLSLPETSRDFTSSQNAIVAHSGRLRKLQQAVLEAGSAKLPSWVISCFQEADDRLVTESINLLTNRNGKPYGAAAVLQDFRTESTAQVVLEFLHQNVYNMLESPSASRLVSLLKDSGQSLAPLLESLLSRPALSDPGQTALCSMLANVSLADVDAVPQIRELSLASSSTMPVSVQAETLLLPLLKNPNLDNSQTKQNLLMSLISNLSTENQPGQRDLALRLTGSMMSDSSLRKALTDGEIGSQLHAKLLILTDSADQIVADQANAILDNFQSIDVNNVPGAGTRTTNLIRDQLAGNEPQLSILSLVELAATQLQAGHASTEILEDLLPSAADWRKAFLPHQRAEIPPALSITSPLQGALYTVKNAPDPAPTAIRDAEEFSLLFRLTLYTTRVLSSTNIATSNATEQLVMQFLPLALQYVNEKLTMESANTLWLGMTTPEVEDEAADILSAGNEIIKKVVSGDHTANSWTARLKGLSGDSVTSYHEALACINVVSVIIDRDGPTGLLDLLKADIPTLHKSPTLIRSAAIISCLRESSATSSQGKRLLNELVSDSTELKKLDTESIRPLVLINILLGEESDSLDGVQPQRVVFLMQNMVKLLKNSNSEWAAISEILKLLTSLLPSVQGIYGDHWQEIINVLLRIWSYGLDIDVELPLLHSSLRLYSRLKSLETSEDANEDLCESLQGSTKQLNNGLMQCLQRFGHPLEGVNQPRQITIGILSRLLENLQVADTAPLYPLLSSHEEAVLGTTYGLLHRTIPKLQEDLSLEFALEKRVIKLPHVLLELIAEPLDDIAATPLSLKRKLLYWQLIFDHWENASYKLREAYLASLKEANKTIILLNRICEIIKITESRPVDASKLEIDHFELGMAESEARELQWLAVHLYYRCLLFTPSLAKAWFIEQKNRIKTPLEAWTQRHISPSITIASFDTVLQWTLTQDQDDNPVTVKASPKSFELTASMEIDPESPAISIAVILPSSYPLNPPSVVSRTRVAVSEKNWQAWLRTFQIIIFSTGSIIEGLIAFRRNVQGAIKGQGECAICYSIIGTDMQTPNKKCGTCKNTFHGSCLFRWFKSSNSSSCPLCRNNFNYA